MIKKPDKKRERQILFGHRQQLTEQLISCTDPALSLHLASILLFQASTEPVFVNVYGVQESIPPAYVACRSGTANRVVVPAR
jgi:hypothetical protein